MATTLLDLALLVLLVVHVLRGARVGGITSILTMVGAVLGGWLVLWQAPGLLARHVHALSQGTRSIAVLALVLLGANIGEVLLGRLGQRVSPHVVGSAARRIDSLVGAIAQGLVTCLVVGVLGAAVRPALPDALQRPVNDSRMLDAMSRVVPDHADRWATSLTHTLSDVGFPRVFSGLEREPSLPVSPPDAAAAKLPAVRKASASIVKVRSDAVACGQEHEGSGWVVARHRVVTNAHVVAGARTTTVQVAGTGRELHATLVAFDPRLDLAVLDVPELTAAPLPRAGALSAETSTVVAGFPLDGDYTARAARVRGTVTAEGDDIYGRSSARREVYSIAATVQPGNSGGPLLTTDGRVAGTVFARSAMDSTTGYVLTDRATADLLERAPRLVRAVGSQGCARD